jgi:hypothetical protein
MLTTASLHKFKSTTQAREISDGQSGLRLLVHKIWRDKKGKPRPGTKSWIMRFRRDGKSAKLTLGRVHLLEANEEEPNSEPIIGGLLTLRAARRLAAQISQQRAQGIDVIGTYAAQKSRERSRLSAIGSHARSIRFPQAERFRQGESLLSGRHDCGHTACRARHRCLLARRTGNLRLHRDWRKERCEQFSVRTCGHVGGCDHAPC